MKYYIIAGEASGDLHASNLVRELKKTDSAALFRGWGGALMEKQGVDMVEHYRNTAFMGFLEVAMHLRKIFRLLDHCKKDILSFQPDAVILVDYPGFNLRIAAFTHQQGIPTFYYVSPQVWAWKENRVKNIRRDVDRLYCILPFEQEFYRKWNYEVEYVGHPLLDNLVQTAPDPSFRSRNGLSSRPLVALLPGSRSQEIRNMLPVMGRVASHFPGYEFVVAGLSSVEQQIYDHALEHTPIRVCYDQTYALLQEIKAALVTSGTATLEAALFKVPQAVCYRGNPLSYWIGRQLVRVKYISLVNLVMDQEVVRELLQDQMNEKAMIQELGQLLEDGPYRHRLLQQYELLIEKLGGPGASARVAASIQRQLLARPH